MDGRDVIREIRTVDIAPVLAVLPDLPFQGVNIASRDPGKSECSVVLPALIPPSIETFVAGLGLGGEVRRILFRRLEAGQGMAPHVDRLLAHEKDWRRFQLPIVTDPRVRMRWPEAGVDVHLEAGKLYEVRVDVLHEVVNEAPTHRVHLQIDQVGAEV